MSLNHAQIIEFVCEQVRGLSDCRIRELGNHCLYFLCTKDGTSRCVLVDLVTLITLFWDWSEGPIAAYVADQLGVNTK